MSQREEQFEAMLRDVLQEYAATLEKMEGLRQEGKTKTVTYKQLIGEKLTLQNLLTRYRVYGLVE